MGNEFDSKGKNESDEDILAAANKFLIETFNQLSGGPEEFQKIYRWMQKNKDIEEVAAFNKSCRQNTCFLVNETRFAQAIRRYEEENKLAKRILGDEEISLIIEQGRCIRVIKDDSSENSLYAYTMGNCTSDPSIPEFIAFYPGEKTCVNILNLLSKLYKEEVVKPILPGEVKQVIGLLGDHSQIPIRIRLLEDEERDLVCEKWYTAIPSDDRYPLVLVDIPDTAGYFAWEKMSYQL